MVQIFVKMSAHGNEWGMIELQGTLETKYEVGLNGVYVGDLHFDEKGTPNLIVGHHLLVGKVVELDKPFAVLKKDVTENSIMTKEEKMDVDDQKMESQSHNYEVAAIIKRKVIFKNRPRPIITNVNLH